MPIRGPKPFMPEKGGPKTNIFSSSGRQKVDSVANFPYKGVKDAAKAVTHIEKPKKRDNRLR